MFGGVGTSIILTALLARRIDVRFESLLEGAAGAVELRDSAASPRCPWEGNVEFLYVQLAPNGVGFQPRLGDLFLTTSWWSTWSALTLCRS